MTRRLTFKLELADVTGALGDGLGEAVVGAVGAVHGVLLGGFAVQSGRPLGRGNVLKGTDKISPCYDRKNGENPKLF